MKLELAGLVEAVLFDKDGTLFDFRATWLPTLLDSADRMAGGDERTANALVRAAGYDPDRDRFLPDGPVAAGSVVDVADAWYTVLQARERSRPERSRPERAARLGGGSGSGTSPAAPASRDELVAMLEEAGRRASASRDVPAADLVGVMQRLREAGIILGLVTSDSTEAAREALRRAGVLERFSYVAGYDAPAGVKPSAAAAKAFYRPLGIAPARVVVVGDTWHDITMARACGCLAIGVLTGALDREDLAPYADAVLENIGELPAFLGV
ncbi:MAG: HAD family hydrolase [Spirochaetaceae bacterium]